MSRSTLQNLKKTMDGVKHRQMIDSFVGQLAFKIAEAASLTTDVVLCIDLANESPSVTEYIWEILPKLREKFPDTYIENCAMAPTKHDGVLTDICQVPPNLMLLLDMDNVKNMIVVNWS